MQSVMKSTNTEFLKMYYTLCCVLILNYIIIATSYIFIKYFTVIISNHRNESKLLHNTLCKALFSVFYSYSSCNIYNSPLRWEVSANIIAIFRAGSCGSKRLYVTWLRTYWLFKYKQSDFCHVLYFATFFTTSEQASLLSSFPNEELL